MTSPFPKMLADRGAIVVGAVLFVCVIVTRLMPYESRPFNMTAIGGLGLFAAARFRLGTALAVVLGAMLISDLLLFASHGYERSYLPNLFVYLCLLVYPLTSQLLLKSSQHALRVGAAATAAGMAFFILSNFLVWAMSTHAYPNTLAGLLECYTMALPFYRGILIGDLVFALAGFRLLEWLSAPARQPAAEAIVADAARPRA